jgi:hypothetical protein
MLIPNVLKFISDTVEYVFSTVLVAYVSYNVNSCHVESWMFHFTTQSSPIRLYVDSSNNMAFELSVVCKGLFTALYMFKEDVATAIYLQFITLSTWTHL